MKTPAMFLKSCAATAVLVSVAVQAFACTRLLLNEKGQTVVVARTMDLFMSDQATLVVRPRGIQTTSPDPKNAETWTSRYGSIAVTALGFATSDGMNEKGLSVNLLYLDKSSYEPPDSRKTVNVAVWSQYVLDNFASVQDALNHFSAVRITPAHVANHDWPMHLSLQDASGDSAVIEFVNGKPLVHHGRQYTVMTNEPALNVQLANLQKYKLFGGTLGLPGDIDPQDRFVRVASFAKMLPAQSTPEEAVASAVNVVRTALNPEGAIDTSGHDGSTDAWPTRWISAADLTHRLYYVQSVGSPHAAWVDLSRLDFNSKAETAAVDVYDPALQGDITRHYTSQLQTKLR